MSLQLVPELLHLFIALHFPILAVLPYVGSKGKYVCLFLNLEGYRCLIYTNDFSIPCKSVFNLLDVVTEFLVVDIQLLVILLALFE